MRILIMSLFFMLFSCNYKKRSKKITVQENSPSLNTPGEFPPGSTAEEVLDLYLRDWESLYESVKTPISFDDIEEENVLGVCITWSDGVDTFNEIRIDREHFEEQIANSPIAARTIIFHELGHCDLDRDHDSDFVDLEDSSRIPYSIMFSSLWPLPEVYSEFDDHYMRELFTGQGIFERSKPVGKAFTRVEIWENNGYTGTVIFD